MKKKAIASLVGIIAVILIAGCLVFGVTESTKGEVITATVEVESTEEFSEIESTEEENTQSSGSMTSENLSDITTSLEEDEYKDPMLENPPIEEVEEETSTSAVEETSSNSIIIVEELDLQLYAQQTCNARDTDTTNGNKVTTIEKSALLHITGRTSNDWYRVEHAASPTNIVYIKASLLGANKPQQPQQSQPSETPSTSGKTETPSKPNQDTNNNTGGSTSIDKEINDAFQNAFDGATGGTAGGEGGEGAGRW